MVELAQLRLERKGTETSGDPQDLKFANGQLITMAFVPASASIPKPPAKSITTLITSVQIDYAHHDGDPATAVTPTTAGPRPRR